MQPTMSLTLNQLAAVINSFDRQTCIDELKHFEAIPMDFTEDFLTRTSVEKLRHILLAAYLTRRKYQYRRPIFD
jgi:hypothetical protein